MNYATQFDTGSFGEFGVQSKYLDREGYLVDNALTGTVPTRKQFEVFKSIILAIAVYVMNGFVFAKFSAKMLGHHVTMFHDGVFFAGDKRRHTDPNVTMAFYVPPKFAILKTLQRFVFLGFNFASVTAKFLLGVYTSAGFAPTRFCFAALLARKQVFLFGGFSAPFVGTGGRTIQRIASILFLVGVQIGSLHRKVLSAVLANQGDKALSRRRSSLESVIASTAQTTKLLFGARRGRKHASAIQTALFYGHEKFLAGFGNRSLAQPLTVVK